MTGRGTTFVRTPCSPGPTSGGRSRSVSGPRGTWPGPLPGPRIHAPGTRPSRPTWACPGSAVRPPASPRASDATNAGVTVPGSTPSQRMGLPYQQALHQAKYPKEITRDTIGLGRVFQPGRMLRAWLWTVVRSRIRQWRPRRPGLSSSRWPTRGVTPRPASHARRRPRPWPLSPCGVCGRRDRGCADRRHPTSAVASRVHASPRRLPDV
jgi:hypothetical protein